MGTMTFGAQTGIDEAQAMVHVCLDHGINFFDTANVYNQGRSEEVLGKALGPSRKDVIVASKVRGVMGEPSRYGGLSREAIRKAIDETLTRLGTDYLDIYYLHQPDYDVPVEESLRELESLRKQGKIRYTGASNYSGWQTCEMLWACEKHGLQPPLIAQPMYNLLARGIEQEFLPFCHKFGVSTVCYNPLAGGLLTGKQHLTRGPLPGTRFDGNAMYQNRYWHKQYFDAVDRLGQAAAKLGLTLVELSLAWLLQQPGADCVIVGASNRQQLEENLRAAAKGPLDPGALDVCNEVWLNLRGLTPFYNR
jgi:aryl-alcohol dehydrogenase-like predicted oxidoreductase